MAYNPATIESKWQKKWAEQELSQAQDFSDKQKFYSLNMFPYVSGDGLHVGHVLSYTASDIHARYLRAKGYNVLFPMGWDAFGLPTENFAIKKKKKPQDIALQNIDRFREQIQRIGISYDWSREVNTTAPEYYKWTQWIFLQMFKQGLAYEDNSPINWCPKCKTGLANEEVVDGGCERCETKVEKKDIRQWILRITEYADRLLKDVDLLDWPEKIKEMQRNWIGKSEGHKFDFEVEDHEYTIDVFTTRIDTLYGATFLVLAPEHPFVQKITTPEQKEAVKKYQEQSHQKSDLERESLEKEKTGVFTGAHAINPASGDRLPIWIADYVMMSYGSGAIMAVPAHDERDFAFAHKYDLTIREVISPDGDTHNLKEAFGGEGIMVNSEEFDGQKSGSGAQGIAEKIGAKTETNYKLRDWVFSRQRYWGEPIPIIHCPNCGIVPVPEKDLPVELPNVAKYEPTGTGESPLANVASWVNTVCPECGDAAKRETNTMPQWAGSCWYYLRYIDHENDQEAFGKKKMQYWCPVDLYVGGAEHAVLHLLYARFWHKVLYDGGFVDHPEPFIKLRNQGMILGEGGVKMSKSKGNVVNPDDVIDEHGADTLRMYEMFMGPFEDSKPWDTKGIIGIRRFLDRVWRDTTRAIQAQDENLPSADLSGGVETLLHKTVKKVTEDIESFRFNTAIAAMMSFLNEGDKLDVKDLPLGAARQYWQTLLQILAPFAPHLTAELWEKWGNKESIFTQSWPVFDPDLIKDDVFEMVIQVNGKVRGRVEAPQDISEGEAIELAKKTENVSKWFEGKEVVKEIYVPGRLVNLVIKN